MIKRKPITVHQINSYIKSILQDDVILSDILVEGEVSNYKLNASGYVYFSLKDDKATINCIIFDKATSGLTFEIEEGMKVVISGNVSLYEKTGRYQLYVRNIEPVGIGGLYLAFEQLKLRLKKEGLFDKSLKKEIPNKIRSIGVVTSETGAVIRDIIAVCNRRDPSVKILIFPTKVQGADAPLYIARAVNKANQLNKCDIIIIARGGGSIEDLWAFNTEEVAYSIFNSRIPIISAIGHETDFTIADFVADIRASTPSVAAEISTINIEEVKNLIENYVYKLNMYIDNKIENNNNDLNIIMGKLLKLDLSNNILKKDFELENIKKILNNTIQNNLNKNTENLANKVNILNSISPLRILKKGFAMIEDERGNIIKNENMIKKDDIIKIRLSDGIIKAKII